MIWKSKKKNKKQKTHTHTQKNKTKLWNPEDEGVGGNEKQFRIEIYSLKPVIVSPKYSGPIESLGHT